MGIRDFSCSDGSSYRRRPLQSHESKSELPFIKGSIILLSLEVQYMIIVGRLNEAMAGGRSRDCGRTAGVILLLSAEQKDGGHNNFKCIV